MRTTINRKTTLRNLCVDGENNKLMRKIIKALMTIKIAIATKKPISASSIKISIIMLYI